MNDVDEFGVEMGVEVGRSVQVLVEESLLVSRAGPFEDVSTGRYVIIRNGSPDSAAVSRGQVEVFVHVVVTQVQWDVLAWWTWAPDLGWCINDKTGNRLTGRISELGMSTNGTGGRWGANGATKVTGSQVITGSRRGIGRRAGGVNKVGLGGGVGCWQGALLLGKVGTEESLRIEVGSVVGHGTVTGAT